MAKKIQSKAASMSPLFPHYDQQELAQSPPAKKKSPPIPVAKHHKKSAKPATVIKRNGNIKPTKQTQPQKTATPKTSSLKKPSNPPEPLVASEPTAEVIVPLSSGEAPISPKQPSRKIPCSDIPEDALPPPRPDPILSLRLSVPLHAKLIAQARDESLSVESLALEMLAESVVLRAWEIVERKNAMRGQNQFQPPNQRNMNHRPPRSGNYGDGSFNQSGNINQQNPQNSHGQSRDQRGGYRRPHQGWTDDQSQFLEYVRNQETRNRR